MHMYNRCRLYLIITENMICTYAYIHVQMFVCIYVYIYIYLLVNLIILYI